MQISYIVHIILILNNKEETGNKNLNNDFRLFVTIKMKHKATGKNFPGFFLQVKTQLKNLNYVQT